MKQVFYACSKAIPGFTGSCYVNIYIFSYSSTEAASSVISNSTIIVKTQPSLPPGEYNITCRVQTQILTTIQAQGELQLLDTGTMTVSSISPLVVERGKEETLSISGSGFVETSQLRCFYRNMNTPLDTTFVSSTEIKCVLPTRLTKRTGE